jgi:serine/threonine-protein kinase
VTELGQTLDDRYRLDAPLGSGGMATVYRAWDLRLDRPVAVKILSSDLAADPSFVARFRQEARTMARVHHPSIVTVHDVNESDGLLYIVMELVEGESLADRLRREHLLSPEALAPILSSVASGLAVLHELGLVHRDVKPHNILLPTTGVAKLADFGLARDGGTSSLTLPGTAIGTLGYLAPELLRGAPATPASDVYAFGVVAYEALTGQRPADAPPPAPSTLASWLGTGFDRPLSAALGPSSGRPTITALADILVDASDEWASGDGTAAEPDRGTGATTVIVPGAGTVPPREVRPGLLVALLAAAILILGGFVAWSLATAPGGPPGSSPTPTPSASITAPTPTLTPSTSPTASPSPTPSPTPAPSTAAQIALGTVDAYDTTVAGLQGGPGGLKGKDAKTLTDLAGQVRAAIQRGDAPAARGAAARLVDQSGKLARELAGDAASRLTSAAQAVQQAVAGL